VSTDVSCLMHLGGLARRAGAGLPMMHVVEVLAAVHDSRGDAENAENANSMLGSSPRSPRLRVSTPSDR
jgi:hypothetical protein